MMNQIADDQNLNVLDENREGTDMPLTSVDVKAANEGLSTVNEKLDEDEQLFDKTPMSLKDIGNMVRDNPDVLTKKDQRSLKVHNYQNVKSKFSKAFLIFNLKTRQIVELQAASALHAVTMIGWKWNKVKLLGEYDSVTDPVIEAKEV